MVLLGFAVGNTCSTWQCAVRCDAAGMHCDLSSMLQLVAITASWEAKLPFALHGPFLGMFQGC